VILESQGRDREAAARFAAAVKQEPDYVEARLGLVHCLQLLGRFEETLPHYRHIVKVDPRRVDAWVNATTVFISLSRYEEARAWLAAARKIHPDEPEIAALQERIESFLTPGAP
jgi:tetratricopeptide (TPR) repeat protein